MAEGTTGIDLSKLEKRMNELANAQLATNQHLQGIDNNLKGVGAEVKGINAELKELVAAFEKLKDEQRLQKALTELVRVRQELETKYGDYKVIRDTMLGVLQATDLALVKQTTISRVSEELMLSTPKYWLAPCLVAVSAWIGNDRDLAERAIAEAVRRDEERTALTMALICRRNNRVQTCYEWLSIYFSHQDPANFSAATFTYIDAYVNGVFGPDERHMCDDYINRWLNEIKGSRSRFEEEQENIWKEKCHQYQGSIEDKYPQLKGCVEEYDGIDSYVGRLASVERITEDFDSIMNASVSQEKLKREIDEKLITLIGGYDYEEQPLREEEEYYKAIRKYHGDEEKAKLEIARAKARRQEEVLDLVERMTKVIDSKEQVMPSEKKTAISFLRNYINKGFNTYITEKKEAFPETITINVNGWKGTTADGSNYEQMCSAYDKHIEACRSNEIIEVQAKTPFRWTVATIAAALMTVVLFVAGGPVGIIGLVATAFCGYNIVKSKKNIETKVAEINRKYSDYSTNGKQTILACINQWNDARSMVDQFANAPVKTLVA